MSLLDKLERLFGRFAISNLSLYLIIGQVFILLAAMIGRLDPELAMYAPATLKVGQWWRVVTFLFVPIFPSSMVGYVFLVFGWYLFYLMGSALEAYWGAFRFNVFFFLGSRPTARSRISTSSAPYFWLLRTLIPISNSPCFSSFPSRSSGWRC
jgi:SNF family Na+-dependent transporter